MKPLLLLAAILVVPQTNDDHPAQPGEFAEFAISGMMGSYAACSGLKPEAPLTVNVRVVVRENGSAASVTLLKPSGIKCVDEVTLSAVKGFGFKPAKISGKKTEAPLDIGFVVSRRNTQVVEVRMSPQDPSAPKLPAEPVDIAYSPEPQITHIETPTDPRPAADRHTPAFVTIRVWLDDHGKQKKRAVSVSGGSALDAAALKAVKEYTFLPGVNPRTGDVVPSETTIRVPFGQQP